MVNLYTFLLGIFTESQIEKYYTFIVERAKV